MAANEEFQPALPMRGVTLTCLTDTYNDSEFQPALPMRGVTEILPYGDPVLFISTRTPHAGSDRNIMRKFTASINI